MSPPGLFLKVMPLSVSCPPSSSSSPLPNSAAIDAAVVTVAAAAAVAAEVEARERKSLGSIGGGADK